MGVVYLAEHTLIGRKAAVKMLHAELSLNEAIVGRFFNEARATTLIKHPGIVEVFDFGRHASGSAYIVMEFLEGESLTARIRRAAPLPAADVVAIGRQIASALGAAHDKGIVHRDLKPDNLFLVPDYEAAGGARVKVLDFGIAKLAVGGDVKTRTGALIGTPMYMSPEQCRDTGDVDLRTDVYALGCILFEAACGRTPFLQEGVVGLISAHVLDDPPRPRSLIPSVPVELEETILRALAKRREDRQASMHQLKAELDGVLGGRSEPGIRPAPLAPVGKEPAATGAAGATIPDHSAGEVARMPPPARRRTMVAVGAVGVALVVAAGSYVVLGRLSMKADMEGKSAIPPPVRGNDAPIVPPAPATEEKPVVPPIAPLVPSTKKVQLTVDSTPSGAKVYRASDGAMLGPTPYRETVDMGDGTAVFQVKLPGYQTARVELSRSRDGAFTAVLVKASVRKPGPDKPASDQPSKPPQNPADYDPFSEK